MARRPDPVPKYERHAPTGTARVRWVDAGGVRRTRSLGKYGSPESKANYKRVVAEILAAREDKPQPVAKPRPVGSPETVAELAAAFLAREVGGYSQSEAANYRAAIALLISAHADTPPAEFGTLALEKVRDAMIAKGWTREHVNSQVRRVRAVFRWGETRELVPEGKWFQLRSLPGLKKGKGVSPDQRVIKPVADDDVEATLPHLSPTVAAMVRFQRLTGCRPQDVCNLHLDDLDRSGEVWVFRPGKHKNQHRGQTREVYIGPKAQEVIRPYLTGGFVFSPRRAWQEKSDQRRQTARRLKPNYAPSGPPANVRDHYDTHAYGLAVERGAERAGVPHWQPNQLRHARGTELRAEMGLEAAQKLLGHKHSRTTERYARPADQAAIDAARKTG